MSRKEKVCVVGLGYIGLPTAALLASRGHTVIGVDINPMVVEQVNRGETYSPEPQLSAVVNAAVKSRRLSVTMSPEEADVFIIAVPTPATVDKRASLGAVVAATESIVPVLRPGNLIILESTVPPGTTATVVVPILERSGLRVGVDFDAAHAPERVLPGGIMVELVHNERVIGGIDNASAERAAALYRGFVEGQIHLTDATTAEMVKLMENTYRDVNIALSNSFAKIGDTLGINIWEAIALANRHPRVNFMRPGPGVGGHCIPVDPWFVVEKAPQEAQLIAMARTINDSMPAYVAEAILGLLDDIPDPQVALLGAAYKANVDDARESPAQHVADLLTARGCQVRVHDPYVYPNIGLMDVVQGADCLALLVQHRDYTDLDPELLGMAMRRRMAFDTQNHFSAPLWRAAGFHVEQLGNVRRKTAAWNGIPVAAITNVSA